MEKLIYPSKLFVLFFLLFLGSCCYIGLYEQSSYNSHIELILDKNNNFIKRMNINSETDTFWGTWSKVGDTLSLKILKPEIFFNSDSMSEVKELYLPNRDSVYFEVIFDNKDPAAFANININETRPTFVANLQGKIAIKREKISRFHISSLYSLPYLNYKVKDSLANYFMIHLHYQDISSYCVLRIEPTTKYLVKQNKLIPLDHSNNKMNSYYLKKNDRKSLSSVKCSKRKAASVIPL